MSTETPAVGVRGLKLFMGVALVAVAIAAVAIGVTREATRASEAARSTNVVGNSADAGVVTVYYFHGDMRCETCLAIEARTAETVQSVFADERAGGSLRFESVNFDAPENRHFRDDYDLAFGSVVVQGSRPEDAWENLADVWTLIDDDDGAFEAYLAQHIRTMLETAG